jgi:hypothetical protein
VSTAPGKTYMAMSGANDIVELERAFVPRPTDVATGTTG